MFENVVSVASGFTRPFIVSTNYFDGEAESTCTSCLVLGDSGYVLVPASSIEVKRVAEVHAPELSAYLEERKQIEAETQLSEKLRRKRLGKLAPRKDWIKAYEFRVQSTLLSVEQVIEHPSVDLALLKISNVSELGVFEKPLFSESETKIGAQICKVGFAFHYLPTSVAEGGLVVDSSALPVPVLPLDGMVTRAIASRATDSAGVVFLETTGGALRSHCGAPVMSADGQVIGVQSFVQPYPTGFNPRVGETSVPQFLNLAWAISATTVVKFLTEHGVL
jgi:hypothetical protein